jgi:hypothetical protein
VQIFGVSHNQTGVDHESSNFISVTGPHINPRSRDQRYTRLG